MAEEEIYNYIDKNSERFIEEFQTLLRQPSISAHKEGVEECSKLVEMMMRKRGIKTTSYPMGNGSPLVYGEIISSPKKKTLLIYGHYDVQPPDPLDLWEHPPFEAKIENGIINGRGTADAKGNLIGYLQAIETLQQTSNEIPINLKFLYEGEEEIGSPHLPGFVEEKKQMLNAQAVIAADGSLDESGRPRINLGLKGILYVQLSSQTSETDHHAMRAPLLANPSWRLIWALNTIKGRDEKILINGWYDQWIHPTEVEINHLKDVGFNDEEIKKRWGVQGFLGQSSGLDALIKLAYDPTCTICGFDSGYKGEGQKTVLPAKAMVKIDFRLGFDQSPDELFKKLKVHLVNNGFSDINVDKLGSIEPSKTPLESPIAQLVSHAAERVYGKKPAIYPSAEGAGPDYLFTKRLGMNSVWTGFSPASANVHAPNEFTTVKDFLLGIKFASICIQNCKNL